MAARSGPSLMILVFVGINLASSAFLWRQARRYIVSVRFIHPLPRVGSSG